MSSRVQAHVAAIRRVQPGKNLHERRLAGAIWTDQPNPLAVEQLEGNAFKQRPAIERPREILATQQQHLIVPGFNTSAFSAPLRELFLTEGAVSAETHHGYCRVRVNGRPCVPRECRGSGGWAWDRRRS